MSTAPDKKVAKSKASEKGLKGSDHGNTEFETLIFTYGKEKYIQYCKEKRQISTFVSRNWVKSQVIRDTWRYLPPVVPVSDGNDPFSAANDPWS